MTPRNRLLAALRGEPVDRVPLMLDGFLFESREEIATLDDPFQREIAGRVYDHTAAFIGWDTRINRHLVTPPQAHRTVSTEERSDGIITTYEIATPSGPLTYILGENPISRTSWTIKYPVETLDDLDRLADVPWELPEGLAPPATDDVDEAALARCLTQLGVSSPFVCVAGAMSYQTYLEWCATEPDLMCELTDVCAKRIHDVMDVMFSGVHIDYLWMGGCEWLTPPMGSPKLYDELVQPYEAEIIRRAHEAGALVHVHCHGNVRSTLEAVIKRGGDFFEPMEPPPDGDITMREAKAFAAGRMTLGGNIEARVIELGDADEVEAAVRAAFDGGKERMVLKCTEGLIRRMTPRMRENYHRLIDVWEECSPM